MTDHIVVEEDDFYGSHPPTQSVFLAEGSNITLTDANFVESNGLLAKRITIASTGGGSGSPGTPALVFSTSNVAGTATGYVATDSTIALFDTSVASTQAFGDVATTGTIAFAAHRDHKHAMPAAPTTIANDAIWTAKGQIAVASGTATAGVLNVGTDTYVLTADSTATLGVKWAAASGGTVAKYATDVGDGTNTSYTITHSLGTLDVIVQTYNKSTGNQVEPDQIRATTNTVTLTFTTAPSSNQFRVVVLG